MVVHLGKDRAWVHRLHVTDHCTARNSACVPPDRLSKPVDAGKNVVLIEYPVSRIRSSQAFALDCVEEFGPCPVLGLVVVKAELGVGALAGARCALLVVSDRLFVSFIDERTGNASSSLDGGVLRPPTTGMQAAVERVF